jgi:hypothetical protein
MALKAKIDHCVEGFVSLNNNATAITAVTTVRAASFNVLLTPET